MGEPSGIRLPDVGESRADASAPEGLHLKPVQSTPPEPAPSLQSTSEPRPVSVSFSGVKRVRPILNDAPGEARPSVSPAVRTETAHSSVIRLRGPASKTSAPEPPTSDHGQVASLKPIAPGKPAQREGMNAAVASPIRRQTVENERPNLRLRKEADPEQLEGNWFVNFGKEGLRRQERIEGPFTWGELSALVVNETLKPTMMVRREEGNDWQPAAAVETLFSQETIARRDDKRARRQQAKARETMEKQREKARRQAGGGGVTGLMGPTLGGMFLMFAAVAWFVGGWIAGYIFFYPPILFFIGLGTFFKGLMGGD